MYRREIILDRGILYFYINGELIKSFPATTGLPGVTDPNIANQGPIPPGWYILKPNEINDYDYEYTLKDPSSFYIKAGLLSRYGAYLYKENRYRNLNQKGDWGHYNVELHKLKLKYNVPAQQQRFGFFIHGGIREGSAGCIDVDGNERDFFQLIIKTNKYDGTDDFLVEVTYTPNILGWENM